MKMIDLSRNIENGQPVYPGLAKTLISTWNPFEETARVQGGGRMEGWTSQPGLDPAL
jgi:kynurenine formamidase